MPRARLPSCERDRQGVGPVYEQHSGNIGRKEMLAGHHFELGSSGESFSKGPFWKGFNIQNGGS